MSDALRPSTTGHPAADTPSVRGGVRPPVGTSSSPIVTEVGRAERNRPTYRSPERRRHLPQPVTTAQENRDTVTHMFRNALTAPVKAGSVALVAIAATFLLGACSDGGDPTAAASTSPEVSSTDVPATDGECTTTGPGSEFRELRDAVTPDVAGLTTWVKWLLAEPVGCTERDMRLLSEALRDSVKELKDLRASSSPSPSS